MQGSILDELFHPITARWFSETLGAPTEAQRSGWTAIRQRQHTLIAAPTGSGKTLAAFLTALDELLREGLEGPLPDQVRVVYVSPLKALSADIHCNLSEPRRGIRRVAEEEGIEAPRITAAVRTGDTSQGERAAMLRTPPHILVTTPESLYLLLTSARSRDMLRTARTVIVDEIHAVIGTKRGAHLALTLERLQQAAERPLVRIGLSATQRPVEHVARFLVGAGGPAGAGATVEPGCAIVDEGHRRAMDLAIEVPESPLEAVMSHEIWEECYERLTHLIGQHRTTLVFVNTRKMAERLARHLSERLGEDLVTAHHGSLSKEKRLDAEQRLKSGQLRALVATASLELGIDIGHVDLVCQIGSTRRIATFLQRVGRSGHTIVGMPKGRLFPTSRDELVECAALLRAVQAGELDRIVSHDAPLDVLAQQIVAETACREYGEDELFAWARKAWPYRELPRSGFDRVIGMLSEGFDTRRGRRGALIHRDEVNARVRSRRGARLLAITSGGAIPEVADYRVLLEPEDIFIGTLNEDFAIESNAGDVFQLGNASWRVLRVGPGVVRVADAKGAPPTIPFWLGEAPGRSAELSHAVSALRREVEARLSTDRSSTRDALAASEASDQLLDEIEGVPPAAASQVAAYLGESHRMLGALPSEDTLVLERFFDEAGGMQLVLHAPFGSRINKAWGLALRKRFCRQFNFELQAAATDDAVLLSLGPQHSFPLADVFRYLHPATARDVLVQAFLDAPVFQTRWRWNTTVALAVPRNRNGRKVAPQIQRMIADDLLAAAFPDAAACLENIPGDRQIPDHPLVTQTVRDCLEEAMDFDGLAAVLEKIHRGELRLVTRDTPEPSPLAHEILNARPYAFLDDAPLEERRTHAVYARRAGEPSKAGDLGALDADAIERVRDEVRPDPRDADELHDALLTSGFLLPGEAADVLPLFEDLRRSKRATVTQPKDSVFSPGMWLAAERLPEWLAVHPASIIEDDVVAPPSRAGRPWRREDALVELLRGRMAITGPTNAASLAVSLAIGRDDIDAALLALEGEGVVLRGSFTPGAADLEWCDRRLLSRIHRYTLNRLRAEIEPVTPADFMRFLFNWQHLTPETRMTGTDGLRALVSMFDGLEIAARAWERVVLPSRMDRYQPYMLDTLCLTGEVGWAKAQASGPGLRASSANRAFVSGTPIALFLRKHADVWRATFDPPERHEPVDNELTDAAADVLGVLERRGASFFRDLAAATESDEATTAAALGELVSLGLVTSDGFGGVRALIRASTRRPVGRDTHASAGRWSRLAEEQQPGGDRDEALEIQARTLLGRYGVVFRKMVAREHVAPWRDLSRVYRRLEARGDIRGGRFVAGVSGEQFALPHAVERLREVRRSPASARAVVVSGADPLNVTGLVVAGERVRAVVSTRILFRHGAPVAALEGGRVRPLTPAGEHLEADELAALTGRRMPVAGFGAGSATITSVGGQHGFHKSA
jgi:ATP-dependent Lhr-like helicase